MARLTLQSRVTAIAPSPTTDSIAYVTAEGDVTLARLVDGDWERAWTTQLERDAVTRLAGLVWRPDGTQVALVSRGGRMTLYDREAPTAVTVRELFGNGETVRLVDWSGTTADAPRTDAGPTRACEQLPSVASALQLLGDAAAGDTGSGADAGAADRARQRRAAALQKPARRGDAGRAAPRHCGAAGANFLCVLNTSNLLRVFADGCVALAAVQMPDGLAVERLQWLAGFSRVALVGGDELRLVATRPLAKAAATIQAAAVAAQGLGALLEMLQEGLQVLQRDFVRWQELRAANVALMRASMGATHGSVADENDLLVCELLHAFLTGRPEPGMQHFLSHRLKELGLHEWITGARDALQSMQDVLAQFLVPGLRTYAQCFDDHVRPHAKLFPGAAAAHTARFEYILARVDTIGDALGLEADLFDAFAGWLRQAFADALGDAVEHYYYDGPMDEQVLVYLEHGLFDDLHLSWLFSGQSPTGEQRRAAFSRESAGEWLPERVLQSALAVGAGARARDPDGTWTRLSLTACFEDYLQVMGREYASVAFAPFTTENVQAAVPVRLPAVSTALMGLGTFQAVDLTVVAWTRLSDEGPARVFVWILADGQFIREVHIPAPSSTSKRGVVQALDVVSRGATVDVAAVLAWEDDSGAVEYAMHVAVVDASGGVAWAPVAKLPGNALVMFRPGDVPVPAVTFRARAVNRIRGPTSPVVLLLHPRPSALCVDASSGRVPLSFHLVDGGRKRVYSVDA